MHKILDLRSKNGENSKLHVGVYQVKYGSGQLILPAIYGAIHRKKLEHKVPEELLLYLQEINTLNKQKPKISREGGEK